MQHRPIDLNMTSYSLCCIVYEMQIAAKEHSTVKSQTQISVIQCQNQQQPIVPIQQLFQHSSQPECSPV